MTIARVHTCWSTPMRLLALAWIAGVLALITPTAAIPFQGEAPRYRKAPPSLAALPAVVDASLADQDDLEWDGESSDDDALNVFLPAPRTIIVSEKRPAAVHSHVGRAGLWRVRALGSRGPPSPSA